MAKPKCELCNDNRAKRKCQVSHGQFICPSCCAGLRNDACEGCRYHQASTRYEAWKAQLKARKHYMIELNEEVEDAVDGAMSLVEKGEIKKARNILHGLEKQHAKNHLVMYGLGTACAIEGNLEDAIVYFEKAIDIFPYFVEAYYNLGAAYQKKFDLRRSVDCMRKVIEIGTDENLVLKARDSIRFLEEGVLKTSHITLDKFLKAQRVFEAAFAHMEKGRWDRAVADFQKCIEINRKHPQSYGNMGICYAELGEKSKALASLDKALEFDPEYEPAIANKLIIKKMREGEPLNLNIFKSIEYYREYPLRKKSYLQSLLNEGAT